MSFRIVTFLLLLISIWAACLGPAKLQAKPVDSYQVKFKRVPPRDFSVAVGASITIECEAFSVPPPSMHWLKNGKRISQEPDEENKLDDSYPLPDGIKGRVPHGATRSRLFIDCIDAKDEAIYTCLAENAFSRISTSTKLSVIQPLRKLANPEEELLANAMEEVAALEAAGSGSGAGLTENQQQQQQGQGQARGLSAVSQCLSEKNSRATEPVRIHFWTHNILEEQKKNALLFCRSNVRKQQQQQSTSSKNLASTQSQDIKKLKPTISVAALTSSDSDNAQQEFNSNKRPASAGPIVSWMTPDEKLVTPEMRDKYEILDSGDLLIKELSWEDMGSFVCTVSDEFTSDSISSFVYPSSEKPPKSKRALINYLGF